MGPGGDAVYHDSGYFILARQLSPKNSIGVLRELPAGAQADIRGLGDAFQPQLGEVIIDDDLPFWPTTLNNSHRNTAVPCALLRYQILEC